MAELKEHYIIFKGEEIVATATTIEKAEEEFNKLAS